MNPAARLPLITKNTFRSGEIQPHHLSHCVIGYILGGDKYLFHAENCYKFSKGDIFFLGMGCHYTMDVPAPNEPFEQIIVSYPADELQRILLRLNLAYKINAASSHRCEKCYSLNHASMPATDRMRLFFRHIDDCLQANILQEDPVVENLKITELLYLLSMHEDGCLKSKLLRQVDSARDAFQQVVHANVFTDISVEELAALCNRSLTSFKKEFFSIFGLSPHQWFIRQRLIHARSLLISSGRAISKIGAECGFPNTSHFIKLFRKQYDLTPAGYRTRYRETPLLAPQDNPPMTTEQHAEKPTEKRTEKVEIR